MQVCPIHIKLLGISRRRMLSKESSSMKLQVVLEPSEDGGFTATVPALPGCISEGETREEALRNIEEAVLLYLEPVEDDVRLGPSAEVLEIAV
jgi:predicted RNase H-like HicB family nuclease